MYDGELNAAAVVEGRYNFSVANYQKIKIVNHFHFDFKWVCTVL